ncbi:VOC family protein [Actinomadura barringtoniae]|uniref:VOC family protein n=1 Tax=Actinomadura barringtoniae TaxID=1427535 RepID=A0A939PB41_9ACTN|nr:VOC family protein [Actinomadura barringtoniae]
MSIDCADPDRLALFWMEALQYELERPPGGYASWTDYWRILGLPEEEVDESIGNDRIVDPGGGGPRLRFQKVPEGKVVKNRLHLDLDVTGGRSTPLPGRKEQLDAEAVRLTALGASVVRVMDETYGGNGFYAITMMDPEGNEFCIR